MATIGKTAHQLQKHEKLLTPSAVPVLDLQTWLPEFAGEKRSEVEVFGMTLEVDAPTASLLILTDPAILRQILENLLENALKYATSGETIALSAREEGEAWRIVVADRGPGVDKAFQARMFERFTRADESLEQSQGGLGIGLSIAREMAHRIGAKLSYEDRPGGGSLFILQSTDEETSPFNR